MRKTILTAALLVLLVGCSVAAPGEESADAPETTAAAGHAAAEMLRGRIAEYSLVRAEDTTKIRDAAMRALNEAFDTLLGDHPKPITDFEAFYPISSKEIVFGDSGRLTDTPYRAILDALPPGGYAIETDTAEERIYLIFRDDGGMYDACEALLTLLAPEADAATVWDSVLLSRQLQRYPFSIERTVSAGMTLPAGQARQFTGKTNPGAAVSLSFMQDGAALFSAACTADADGAWHLTAEIPDVSGEGELVGTVNGKKAYSLPDVKVGQIGRARARGFTVSLDGAAQRLYQTPHACFLIAESEKKTVRVTVTYDDNIRTAAVQPASAGITPTVEGKTLTFDAPIPSKLSVELNGNLASTVQLFLYAPESEAPQGEGVLYYGPGEYTVTDPIRLDSGQTLYLAAGAVLHAKVECRDAENITIAGRGIIDTYDMAETRMLVFKSCKNITLRDYTLTGPRSWMTVFEACEGANASGINIIGSAINSDGIDIVSSKNITVRDAYICANDDCIAIKANDNGGQGDVENITVADSILWNQQYGNGIEIGYETRCESISGIRFADIDLIHIEAGAAMSIHLGDRAHVRDVLFSDIRVQDARGVLLEMFIKETRYTQDTVRGKISDIRFENIALDARSSPLIRIDGFDAAHTVSDVTFDGITRAGETLSPSALSGMKFTHAENIRWDGEVLP